MKSGQIFDVQFLVLKHVLRSLEPKSKVSAFGLCVCLSTKYIKNGKS
jgi:hypothetical protein